LAKRSGSTYLQLSHLKNVHPEMYNNFIKNKLENPDMPDVADPSHPIWQFFEDLNLGETVNNKSARCLDCLEIFPYSATENTQNTQSTQNAQNAQNTQSPQNTQNLVDHLHSQHPLQQSSSYESLCSEWRLHRTEEAVVGLRIVMTGGVISRKQRTVIWDYFERTDDKTKNR
jgi:hypothetical protein